MTGKPGIFDRFATWIDRWTSRSWFFAVCALIVVVWAPSFFLVSNIDTWQLLINTPTTVITFLLVALQCNTQRRANDAEQKKLNAIAEAQIDLLQAVGAPAEEIEELRRAVGLEHKENT